MAASRWKFLFFSSTLVSMAAVAVGQTQESTPQAQESTPQAQESTTQTQEPTTDTQVRRGEVVYVSGNDVVVRLDNGQVKSFNVPDDFRFNVNGKEISVHELQVGTHLEQTITTTSTPTTVTAVRTISGRVWRVTPPFLWVTLTDGTNKQYRVPDGTVFNVGGEQKSVFDLRPGMNLTATITTVTPEVNVSRNAVVSGTAPPPATPPQQGVILIEQSVVRVPAQPAAAPAQAAEAPAPEQTAQATPAPQMPKTASSAPLFGLIGMLAVSAALLLRAGRRRA